VNGIGGLLFLGSCVVGRPLTQVVAERFNPDLEPAEPGAEDFRRKAHILLSAMWGVGLLIAATIVVGRRLGARWEQRRPRQG
jgi:hypothetical protein